MPQTEFIAHARTADGWSVPVSVTRKRVRNLNLRVHTDGTVSLSVPPRTSANTVQDFLSRKAPWIRERVERRQAAASTPLVPTDGPDAGMIPLWGNLVDATEVLDLESATRPSTFARFIGNDVDAVPSELRNPIATLSTADLQARIDGLYRRETACVLPGIVAATEHAMGVHATGWQLRRMTSRWGSCTPGTGAIRINTALAAYPPACLEYVVAHELTHLMEPSHDRRFHMLLDSYCPRNHEIARLLKRPAREIASGRPPHKAARGRSR